MAYSDRDSFLQDLADAQAQTKRYLADRKSGKPGEGFVLQLEALRAHLERIEREVRSGRLTPKPKRPGISVVWVIPDSWNPDDPLGHRILAVDSYYSELP